MIRAGICLAVLGMLLPGLALADCDLPDGLCEAQAEFDHAVDGNTLVYEKIRADIESGGYASYLVDPEYLEESLVTSQQAWLTYRDAQCQAVFRLMSGGTSRDTDELNCLAELTVDRTRLLIKLYDVDEAAFAAEDAAGLSEALTGHEDFSWLQGVWFDACDGGAAMFSFDVHEDGVYALVYPDRGDETDRSLMSLSDVQTRNDGSVDIMPDGWDNQFVRLSSDGEDRIIGDLYERFPDGVAAQEELELMLCPA